MKSNKFETELVEVTEFFEFSTVGELREILSKFSDCMSFGFRNQPFQNLHHIKYKDNSSECLCFQENENRMSNNLCIHTAKCLIRGINQKCDKRKKCYQ